MTINEILEILTPENARFVAGQDLFLYVPKAQTDKRYGLAKYSPDDFSIDTKGVLSLLLPKSQIEDYFDEIRGGTRENTVAANPAINLFNLDKTDKILDDKIDQQVTRLDNMDNEIYGSNGREGTVLNNIDLTNLNLVDVNLQKQIDDLIQDDKPSTSTTSTYSASKITQLIKDAKMEGLHFVGFIGSEVGKDYNGASLIKEGALWHVSNETTSPTITNEWSADTMYKCVNGEWVKTTAYIPQDFEVWKNVNLSDDKINTWWYFEGSFEVLDFTVDMSLYYTKAESDAKFKSIFTYGSYLSETNSVLNIDTDNLPTKGSLTSFVKGTSSLNVNNVEDAIKLLETNVDNNIDIINTRARILDIDSEPFREGDYAFNLDGVYKSVEDENTPGKYIWSLVSKDLDDLLPRLNANRNIVTGISFSNDETTGYLLSSVSLINLNTESEGSSPVSIPVATSNTDGIMPSTAMQAISNLDVRVTALQSGVKSYFVTMPSDSPSQDALDLLYQQASGETGTPPNLTRLIDSQRNIYFEYNSTLETHWQGAYVYRYTTASLIQLGLVKSSEQNGQIYVENSTGVMSLNGYTDIINTFNTLYGGSGRTSIALSQVPELPASKITSGTLDSNRLPVVPITKGGTGVSTFSANKILVSGSEDDGALREGPAFGEANTVLVGQGASTLPEFKTRDEAGLELVSRKITSWGTPTNTEYPSALLVKTAIDTLYSDIPSKNVTIRTGRLTWNKKTWHGFSGMSGSDIWTDGENIYYSSSSTSNIRQYVLDKSTSTWNKKTWKGLPDFRGNNIWTDGTNIYHSNGVNQYVLNKSTSTWKQKTWNGLKGFNGDGIWTDGENIYYSYGPNQYVLNKSNSTWNARTWNGLSEYIGSCVWTDGENIYYSSGSDHYVLDKSTSTWNSKTWNGLSSFRGTDIWTDGTNIYHSNGPNQYVLDKSTSTWNKKTWTGLRDFMGSCVWTDGTDIYYSSSSTNFVLKDYILSAKPVLNK